MSQGEFQKPYVSVVIPTTLRSSVKCAIASARRQSIGSECVQVIAVVDCRKEDVRPSDLILVEQADEIIFTGGKGAAAARNAGVEASEGEWIAFLDDDDEWLPQKLERQLPVQEEQSEMLVVSCQVVQRRPGAERTTAPIPARCFSSGNRVENYLFINRSPTVRRQSLFTSTLLAHSRVAKSTRWDVALKRHQDWDWLLRAQSKGAHIRQIPAPLVAMNLGSVGSISARADWESSLAWVTVRGQEWARQAVADFLIGQCLRYAFQGRSLSGAARVMAAAMRNGRFPSLGPIITCLGGLLPRPALERAMLATATRRKSKLKRGA